MSQLPDSAPKTTAKSTHWAQMTEAGGGLLGMRFLLTCFKLGGRPLFKLVLAPVIFYFFLFRTQARTASLAYAVINPAIGLGTFLAQVFLRKPLTQAGTREFKVSGPWADPQVERVERKLTDPVPDLSAPVPASGVPPAAPLAAPATAAR